ncbi:MAG TPA: hypothetical protein VFP84_10860 [Kofleriaceae bacterium]|nr:hypothetical protein [Kofleriaceae bacterium]
MAPPAFFTTFTRHSTHVATWTVAQPEPGFGVAHAPGSQQYDLGFHGRPRYQLDQPYSPDDGWEITPLPAGTLITDMPHGDANGVAAREYAMWSSGWGSSDDLALLERLPAATYTLVRCRRPLANPAQVLLGNERIATRPYFRVLNPDPPVYSLIIGADSTSAPTGPGPLLGFAILNYVGDSWMHGLLFFQYTASRTAAASDDRLLIIPTDGELVVDNMSAFSAEGELRSKAQWQAQTSMQFARWCAGESDDPER